MKFMAHPVHATPLHPPRLSQAARFRLRLVGLTAALVGVLAVCGAFVWWAAP